MKWNDKLLHHREEQGLRHRLARFLRLDQHERAPLPSKRVDRERDPFDRIGRRIKNRARERSRAVGRSRGQVMRS